MASFRTEVTTFPELRRTLRAVQDCVSKLEQVAGTTAGLPDLPGGVAGVAKGQIMTTNKHGEWIVTPGGAPDSKLITLLAAGTPVAL